MRPLVVIDNKSDSPSIRKKEKKARLPLILPRKFLTGLTRNYAGLFLTFDIMPPTEEDIAWFKSTFHPIPKPRLPDDCVEYSLHVFSSSAPSDDDLRSRLREVQKLVAQLQKESMKDYIWQRQGFALELVKEDGEEVCQALKVDNQRCADTSW